jgi:hypothetical protein
LLVAFYGGLPRALLLYIVITKETIMTTVTSNLFLNSTEDLSEIFDSKRVLDIQRLQALPGSQASKPSTVVGLFNMGDRIMVTCSDKKIRAIVTRTVNNTFGTTLSTEDIMARMEKHVGNTAIFFSCSVKGRSYSPDVYFIGLISI